LPFAWSSLQPEWEDLGDTWLTVVDPSFINPPIGLFADITDNAFGMSTARGRNRDLQRTNAGSFVASLRNESRQFDPQAESDLAPFLKPRVPVTVKVDGFTAFSGLINDWDYAYSVGGESVATISGADAFALFAQETAVGTAVVESSGERLNRVLDSLPIPFPVARRVLDAGNATFHADEFDSNALSYLQSIEESEGGLIFMSKSGDFSFQQRLLQPADEVLAFSDDGPGIPYENIEITFGTDLLSNDVTVTSVDGTAVAINEASRSENGVAQLSVDSLLAGGSLQGLADYLLFRFGVPEYRIAAVTVNLRGLSMLQRADLLALELGTQADVIFTPNRVGDPISIRNRVTGISHDIGLDEHRVTFNFEALGFAFFILDDDPAGKLDNTDFVLGF